MKEKTKKTQEKKVRKSHGVKHNTHFGISTGALVLAASYAFFSFFTSTNQSLDRLQTNVLAADQTVDTQDVSDSIAYTSAGNPFVDVEDSNPHLKGILAMYYQGLMSDDGYGKFYPDSTVNRAEFVKLVLEAADVDLAEMGELSNCFSDVTSLSEQWFAVHVCAAAELDLVSGREGNFYPGAEITQAAALKIALNAFAYEIPEDPEKEWYVPIRDAAYEHGLIDSLQDFDPAKNLSRSEVASIIYHLLEN